jgi:putative endonuclease
MYTIYIIKSKVKNFTYVGFTNNLERRLFEHNSGYNKSTKAFLPFDLVYSEEVENSIEARKREKFYKSGKRREFIKEKLKLRAGLP